MNEPLFQRWLQAERKYQNNTIASNLSRIRRIEKKVGNLDTLSDDALENLRESLSNPAKTPLKDMNGNVKKGASSCKNALKNYQAFRLLQAT
jgi:hypothetical protein